MASPSAGPETVLITGASSGIGRELAHCFARAGSDCILLARTEEALQDLAETLDERYDVTGHVLTADLSVPGIIDDVRSELEQRDLTVDVLVNNAGFGARGAFAEIESTRQRNMIRVNVTALTELARLLVPGMVERGRGGILNVASTAGFQPGPNMSVYYATKAYVLSFSEGLHEELSGTGVTVTCLAPGPTRTGFIEKAGMGETALFRWGGPMTSQTVAQRGYDGFRAGRALVVPGLSNKIGAFLVRFTPRPVVRKIASWLNQ